MQISHRITFGKHDLVEDALTDIRVKYHKTSGLHDYYLVSIDIEESDPVWPAVEKLARSKNAVNMVETFFTPQEILNADWSRLAVVFEQGYPQPKEDWSWETITYENKCTKCGAGYSQKAPFRIAKEPRMGRKDFMGLYWTWTAFCTEKVTSVLRKSEPRGYEVWVPLIHGTGVPSTTISQLVWKEVSKPALAEEDKVKPETCPQCGITKYAYHKRGYMRLKRDALPADVDFVQIYEWFGSGGASFREVLVSNRVARLIIENKWSGLRLKPVELI